MKFQRFSVELRYNNETFLNNLQHKINLDLQRVMLNKQITNLNKFANICMQADFKINWVKHLISRLSLSNFDCSLCH